MRPSRAPIAGGAKARGRLPSGAHSPLRAMRHWTQAIRRLRHRSGESCSTPPLTRVSKRSYAMTRVRCAARTFAPGAVATTGSLANHSA